MDYGFKELLILQNFLPCKMNTAILQIKYKNLLFLLTHEDMLTSKKSRRQWYDENIDVYNFTFYTPAVEIDILHKNFVSYISMTSMAS